MSPDLKYLLLVSEHISALLQAEHERQAIAIIQQVAEKQREGLQRAIQNQSPDQVEGYDGPGAEVT
jgi:hypothetical protein